MIFQSDLTIKSMIQLGLDDIRKNDWLIDDILGDIRTNPYLTDKYESQIAACKEWFKNNQVDIYMANRRDRDRFPCITITLGTSQEKDDMKTMADQSTETIKLLPNTIGKPIPYVVKPFSVYSYDPTSGEVTLPVGAATTIGVAIGMILVDPATGKGYSINDVTSNGFMIEPSLTVTAGQLGVLPQYQFYQARIEHSFFQETYNIGCHVHGDPQALLWLHSVVLYSILRYRESLLEAQGFGQCTLSSSDLMANGAGSGAAGEEIWTRYITLTGMVENSWIKSPRRIIESAVLKDKDNEGFMGGIKIISNLDTPNFIDKSTQTWSTIEDDGDES